MRGSSEPGHGTSTGGRAGKCRLAVMHGPVDGEVSRSSRIRPSIAATLARPWGPGRLLPKDFRVRLRVEAHEERAPHPEGRRPQATRGAKQERQQLGPTQPGRLHIDADHPLAPDDVDLVDVPGHGQGGLSDDRRFPRVDLLADRDPLLPNELFRFAARASALPVIAPVDSSHGRYLYHNGVPPPYWPPPVLWMAVIMWLSSDVGSAEHTEHWLLPILPGLAPWAGPAQLQAPPRLPPKGGHPSQDPGFAPPWVRA